MIFGVSGCPGGTRVGRQRLTETRRDSLPGAREYGGIAEPAAGPAESCQKAVGQISVTADGLAAAGVTVWRRCRSFLLPIPALPAFADIQTENDFDGLSIFKGAL